MQVTTPTNRPLATTMERVTFFLLAACIAATQLSIAAAQLLLAATAIGWIALLLQRRVRFGAPPFFPALLAYAGATLVSAAFSLDPLTSFVDSRQLLLFALVPIVYTVATRERAWLLVTVVVSVGAVSAAAGIVQFVLLQYDTLGRRPDGTLTHYMTYSGTLMLVICAATARLVFGARDRAWAALVMPALVAALALTLTRSAWVGASAAVGLLLIARDLRLVALLPVGAALMLAFAPDTLTSRMLSMFDLQDPSNRDRVAMMRSGAAMVAEDPLTGVGPDMIPAVYERYRHVDAVNAGAPHLHNVPLQIAAERGLPALATWTWFVVAAIVTLLRRTGRADPTLRFTALAAIAAMLAAGMFEYNFGDSEFLMLFLALITLPFAAARESGETLA
jgi:putative inorganic carbon (hco3(-)) transporter